MCKAKGRCCRRVPGASASADSCAGLSGFSTVLLPSDDYDYDYFGEWSKKAQGNVCG